MHFSGEKTLKAKTGLLKLRITIGFTFILVIVIDIKIVMTKASFLTI